MSDQVKQVTKRFLSFPQVLTILFILLKVFNKIAWSWLIVFAPLWAPFLIVMLIVLGFVSLCIGVAIFEALLSYHNRTKLRRN